MTARVSFYTLRVGPQLVPLSPDHSEFREVSWEKPESKDLTVVEFSILMGHSVLFYKLLVSF